MNYSPEDIKHLWRIGAPQVFRAAENNFRIDDLVAIVAERNPDRPGEGTPRTVTFADAMRARTAFRQRINAGATAEDARILEENIAIMTDVVSDIVETQRKADKNTRFIKKIEPNRLGETVALPPEALDFK